MAESIESIFALLRVRIESETKRPAVLMVTSAQKSDGKSLVAHGLATCLARVGHRAVLVNTSPRPATVEDAQLERNRGFDFPVIPLSSLETGPEASRESVYAFVNKIRCTFDYAIVDAPPLIGSGVAILLAGAVDAVIVTLRHGRQPTSRDEAMVQTLRQAKAKVFGVVACMPENIAAFEQERRSVNPADSRIVVVEPRVEDVSSSALFAR